MQTCRILKRLFLLDWFLVKPYTHHANSGWQLQASATGHEEITYTANQHMASEKKSCGIHPAGLRGYTILVPVVPL